MSREARELLAVMFADELRACARERVGRLCVARSIRPLGGCSLREHNQFEPTAEDQSMSRTY